MAEHKASSALLAKIRPYQECSICHETFEKPKMLRCTHSFCNNCLCDLMKGNPNSKKICCPLCRQDTVLPRNGTEGLKTNFPLFSLVEDITNELKGMQEQQGSSDGHMLCGWCRKRNLGMCFQCLDCPMDLCESCREIHPQVTLLNIQFMMHTIVSHDELKSGKYGPSCQDHDMERKRFYCTVCEELVCRRCFEDTCAVSQHERENIEDVAEAKRASLRDLAVNLQRLVTKISSGHTNEKKKFLAGKKNRNEVVENIRQEAAKIRDSVTTAEERLLEEVEKADQSQEQRFAKYEVQTETTVENFQKAIDSATCVAWNSSNGDLLSVGSLFIRDLQEMVAQSHTLPCIQPEFMQFIPSPGPRVGFGRLIRSSTRSLVPYGCFGERGRVGLRFCWARAIAVHSSGSFAVADCDSKELVLLEPLGQVSSKLKLDKSELLILMSILKIRGRELFLTVVLCSTLYCLD